ncbi:MAG: ABC transporter ATP-binding protein [Kangiellaceae bacterium]|nr:ABC transporter ATP-binding protein [Kangiellaceae bacterium]
MSIAWRQLLNYALAHKKRLVVVQFVAILTAVLSVPLPLLLPLLVDEVLLEQPGNMIAALHWLLPPSLHAAQYYILSILIITIFLRLATVGLNIVQSQQFAIIAKNVTFYLRTRLINILPDMSIREFESEGSGKVASHFVTDIETIDQFIGTSISRCLVSILSVIGTAVILLLLHWQLALFILFFNPLVIYCTMRLGKKVKKYKRRENEAFSLFQEALTETLDAMQQIRALNKDRSFMQRLVGDAEKIKDSAIRFSWKSDASNRLSFVVFLLGFDIFRALAMGMVVFSDLTIGQMFAIFGYLWFMMGPVQELLNIQYSYYSATAALARINSFLDKEKEPVYPCSVNPFDSSAVAIQFNDVCFSYQDETLVLNHLSLSIKPGKKVAIVGASGGGKSTLVHILLGLYQPQSGQIRFNGVDYREVGLTTIRENVATVLQHPALFNDSIRNNLCMGEQRSEQAVWQALSIAELAQTIEAMPDGLDTIIGNRGVRLSGGQKQRLAIARMVLKNPKVVVLDEATSALDSETEFKVHQNLQQFLENRTTVIVAHRLSAIKQADTVYVFEDGKICEHGHHDELVSRNGLYAKLYGDYST